MKEMYLFAVEDGKITLLGGTEENENVGAAYPERVQLFGSCGWDISPKWISSKGLIQTFDEAPGYVCGDIYFAHECEDMFISALDCLLYNRASGVQEVHWLFNDIDIETVSDLENGIYII